MDIHEYSIKVPLNTESLDIKTETEGKNVVVDIAGNENLQQGENIITLLVRNGQEETSTYQIVATLEDEKVDLTEINSSFKDLQRQLFMKKVVLMSVIAIIVILIIVFLIQRYKIQSSEEDNNDNDNIYNNFNDMKQLEESEIKDEEVIVRKKKKKGNHFK